MIIKGKAVFTCPQTGQEVLLHETCTNIDHQGNNCPFFKHWSWQGAHPVLVCIYDELKKKEANVATATLKKNE